MLSGKSVFIPCSNTGCLKPVFEIISNTDANFLNLHIDKATKTRGDKQLFSHTFCKQTLNLNYLLLTLNVTVQFLNYFAYLAKTCIALTFLPEHERTPIATWCMTFTHKKPQLLNYPKQKCPFFFEILNSRSIVATSCFGSLSTSL